MILKALYDYYQRSQDMAPEGFEEKEIPFIICIDQEGTFKRLEDMRIDKRKAKSFVVIKNNGRTSAPMPNVLWDNIEYVLNYTENHLLSPDGLSDKEEAKHQTALSKSADKNRMFIEKVQELSAKYPENETFRAITKFYEQPQLELIREDRLWSDIEKKPTVNISFRLISETTIAAEQDILEAYVSASTQNSVLTTGELPVCLITGEKAETATISTATMIPGSQATAKLVAFQTKSGYDSFGKSQGMNAPISKKAEAAYTTALNRLLGKDSLNKLLIGNRTFLFWASSQSEAAVSAEQSAFTMFNEFKTNSEDNPNKRIEDVRKTFQSIFSGALNIGLDDRFYFLALAPNAARIAVVYWNESSLHDFAKNILQHFDDMEMIDTRKEKRPYYGLYPILRSIALQGKTENIPPNLPEAVMKSILQSTPYPTTLFQACIRRIRATQEIGITRAAIIKGYINRKLRNNNYNNEKFITMAVDKENTNPGYLCGRLFAILEHAQERSNGINTIRERYMNAASSTPSTVFPTLLNLSVHHVEKLNKSLQIFYEREKGEIIGKLTAEGFPIRLNLDEQGRFMVGYYHQRQYLFTPKENTEAEQS